MRKEKKKKAALFSDPSVLPSTGAWGTKMREEKKTSLVLCTWKWHPINSNRILLGLAASAGVGHSLNPESSPPSLLKAFSLMTLPRWEKGPAQKGLESKGGIDPGKRPSSLSLPPPSCLLPPPPLLLFPVLLHLSVRSYLLLFSHHLLKSGSPHACCLSFFLLPFNHPASSSSVPSSSSSSVATFLSHAGLW